MTSLADDYSSWIGRTESVEDDISLATAEAAAATLDEPTRNFGEGAELPPLWHWFYFLAKTPQARTRRRRASTARGPQHFMPPIPYPRRMFAGARLHWRRPLVMGAPARREAVIRKIVQKSGRSGELAFVTVAYTFFQGNALCLEEEQDIVYRQRGPALTAPEPLEPFPQPGGAWSRWVVPDTRLLFRFSAPRSTPIGFITIAPMPSGKRAIRGWSCTAR